MSLRAFHSRCCPALSATSIWSSDSRTQERHNARRPSIERGVFRRDSPSMASRPRRGIARRPRPKGRDDLRPQCGCRMRGSAARRLVGLRDRTAPTAGVSGGSMYPIAWYSSRARRGPATHFGAVPQQMSETGDFPDGRRRANRESRLFGGLKVAGMRDRRRGGRLDQSAAAA
jgi:hypothetical protein